MIGTFYAPDVVKNIREINELYKMNDHVAADLFAEIENINQNISITSADEGMVERWEKMLNLSHNDDDSIEVRKFNIKSKINEKLPYSKKIILNRLDTLCGADGHETFIFPAPESKIVVKLKISNKTIFDEVEKMLDEIIPVDMIINVTLLYNTNEYLSRFPNYILAMFTNEELKEWNLEEHLSKEAADLDKLTMEEFDAITVDQLQNYGIRKVE